MSDQRQIFTLKQVVSSIRKTIEERYKSMYWVKAEMHKLNRFASGHCFPELLQKEEGKIVAQINGTIWKHNFEQINRRFIEVVKEPLKEDTTLLMLVKVSFHEVYGMSLQIMDIDPNYALGELQRERQETLLKLQKEGLLNANQKLSFPLLPQRVAVISADSSKGLSDFKTVLDQNEWGYAFFTMLFPAYLQGDLAAQSIISQLKQIKKVQHHFDVVVIVRGGGGEIGLSCYNNYELCREIASFPLPVLTGIGHSTNFTVAEMISFRNAITPTELADFLLQAFHDFSIPLKDARQILKHYASKIIDSIKKDITNTSRHFKSATDYYIQGNNHRLAQSASVLKSNVRKLIHVNSEIVNKSKYELHTNLKFNFHQERTKLADFTSSIPYQTERILLSENAKIDRIQEAVRLLDPINVLKRGYSLTLFNAKTVNTENPVGVNDKITTITAEFEIESEIRKVKKQE